MNQRYLATLPAMLALALAACSGGKAPDGLPAGLPVAETVNGQPVPQVLLEALAKGRELDLSVPEQRERALKELTDYVLLAQEAGKQGFAKDTAFAAEVEISRLQGIANASIVRIRNEATIDDSVLKGEYDRQTARAGTSRYDFTQLLFDKEETALAVADEAMAKPFAEVFDAWRGKALQAGAYPGVHLNQIPEPLAKVLATLKAGETSKVPVQTPYGWHVVHVTATTPFTPPKFEDVKDGIRATLVAQLSDRRLEKLRSDAKIEVATPTTTEPAPPAPADAAR